jgi:pyridoxal phosphate enzyme (YggS family)
MAAKTIAENLGRIEGRICAAAARAGRARAEITLIGVSKTHGAAAIREAYAAGLRHFGENRVQEWEAKRGEIAEIATQMSGGASSELPGAVWHLIGHLQSNKAGRAAGIFDCVDSVDNVAVAERLARAWVGDVSAGAGATRRLRVLMEVRVAEEETKSGVAIGALPELAERIAGLEGLELAGLMCVPPFLEDAELVRPYFRVLREARDGLRVRLGRELPVLSMGMSHDFEVAIEEGATEVRVGTGLFGVREVGRWSP